MKNQMGMISAVVLGSLLALCGCAAETTDDDADDGVTASGDVTATDDAAEADGAPALEDEALPDPEEEVASTQDALNGWTSWTSEEYPPVGCGPALVDAVACNGWCCDNIALGCQPVNATLSYATTWTSYFSEEGTNYRYCPSGAWMTGIACNGWYCDNISLQCTYAYNVTPANCYWTGWMSEESGSLYFGVGYYARGVQCNGAYCDNKRFYVCQMY